MKISKCKIRGIAMYENDIIANMHSYIRMQVDMHKLVEQIHVQMSLNV